MGLLRAHLAAVSIVVAAVAALGGVFALARPQYHPYQLPSPPGDGLPYTTPTYTRADALRAFTGHGIHLVPDVLDPGITGFFTRDQEIYVGVFGDRKVVDGDGFSDYSAFVNGHWVLPPKNCVAGAKSAERWRGNVRLIVYCDAPGNLPRAVRALDALSRD